MNYKKEWNDIEMPEELESVIRDAVGKVDLEVERKKKTHWLWNTAIATAGIAAALLIFTTVGFMNPMIAQAYTNIPVIGKVFAYLYQIDDYYFPYAEIADNASPVQVITEEEEPSQTKESEEVSDHAGVEMEIQESYCDGYSLYLSMRIVSEEPFYEGEPDMENVEAAVQIFSSETLDIGEGQIIDMDNGSLNLEGVFTDPYTFLGIGRCGGTLEEYDMPENFTYQINAKHLKVYSDNGICDFRGKWQYSVAMKCETEPLETRKVEKEINSDMTLQEIRLQPYEVQVAVDEKDGANLATEILCIEVFDNNGNRLEFASDVVNRFVSNGDEQTEVWMFKRPLDAESITVFVLDDIKWLDEWKGHLYSENPWTGAQMMEFLKENCVTYAEAEL